ncbi:MAG: hypothetical protein J6B24_07585 [Clostridia bacterium]|nr:hypothetical protein [Clostridia bacterium]
MQRIDLKLRIQQAVIQIVALSVRTDPVKIPFPVKPKQREQVVRTAFLLHVVGKKAKSSPMVHVLEVGGAKGTVLLNFRMQIQAQAGQNRPESPVTQITSDGMLTVPTS